MSVIQAAFEKNLVFPLFVKQNEIGISDKSDMQILDN
jgi:hypothetical protein